MLVTREGFVNPAEELLKRRFGIVNVWRPIRGPVQDSPLALYDARTFPDDDSIAGEFAKTWAGREWRGILIPRDAPGPQFTRYPGAARIPGCDQTRRHDRARLILTHENWEATTFKRIDHVEIVTVK